MTKREAAIVSLYTGFMCGEFGNMQEYAEELMGFPIFTHMFGDKTFVTEMKAKCKSDFVSLKIEGQK